MGYVLYVLGALSLLLALYMGTIGAPVDPMGRTVAWAYAASLVGASIGLFAFGRVIDLLARIAANTDNLKDLKAFSGAYSQGHGNRVEPKL